MRPLDDGIDGQIDEFVVYRDFEAHFFEQIDLYFVSAIIFAIPPLPSASEGIRCRNPVNLVLEEFLLHFT